MIRYLSLKTFFNNDGRSLVRNIHISRISISDVLDAAAEVVDFQLRGGISMEVTAVCTDGATLRTLASGLRELVDAITDAPA